MSDQSIVEKIASAANYPGLYDELLGYVGQTIDDEGVIDPRWLHEYLRELKRRYVTEPVSAAIAEAVKK